MVREREIMAFVPEEYWTIVAKFGDFDAELFKYKSDDIELKCKEDADKVLESIGDNYLVESVEKKEKNTAELTAVFFKIDMHGYSVT